MNSDVEDHFKAYDALRLIAPCPELLLEVTYHLDGVTLMFRAIELHLVRARCFFRRY